METKIRKGEAAKVTHLDKIYQSKSTDGWGSFSETPSSKADWSEAEQRIGEINPDIKKILTQKKEEL